MREMFIEYADKLLQQKDLIEIYNNLIKIFNDNCMFHEVGACKEKLWHITQDPELYKEVGNIFLNMVGNSNIAIEAYHRYLQYKDRKFFENYKNAIDKIGCGLNITIDNDDYSKEITRLCDVHDTIIFMMICLHKEQDYKGLIMLEEKLSAVFNMIMQYKNQHTDKSVDNCISEIQSSREHLSQILSETEHHNEINMLAIKLNSNNKQAYINIIGDYITYKNYNDAILFYNYTYCNMFKIPQNNNIVDICWKISDFYRDNYNFYNAVLFQKFALELELAEG